MTTINIRIEEKTKAQATKALARIGLDMSGAIKVFLSQVIKEDGLPFIPSNNPAVIRARWDAEAEEALKKPGFRSAAELHNWIMKQK